MFTGLLGDLGFYTTQQIQEALAAMAFKGALVKRSSNQIISNDTDTVIEFDTEVYDTDSIHEGVTNPSRLTVPAGATYVRGSALVTFGIDATGRRVVKMTKNGASFDGRGRDTRNPVASGTTKCDISSAVVSVTPGDYFELVVYQNSGDSLVVNKLDTWFALEIVE